MTGPNDMAKAPSVVTNDIADVFAVAGKTPIYFYEAGYPISSAREGYEVDQSLFVDQIFAAWDLHASPIPVQFIPPHSSGQLAWPDKEPRRLGGRVHFDRLLLPMSLRQSCT